MEFTQIRYEVEHGVATLTLNRPERLNAFSVPMMHEMIAAFDQADADDRVRAVIVTGAGRGYCAGADLDAGPDGFRVGPDRLPLTADGGIDYGAEELRDGGGLLTLRIHAMLKPVIAAVNGPAVGIGSTMLLPMDIRLASEQARFGFVFARRGIVPEGASSFFLPRVVGIGRAVEWSMTGRIFGAGEALAAGLVNAVHAPDDLLPAAMAVAREIADNTAPVSVALTRQMLWDGLGMLHPMEAHRLDSRATIARALSADAREGVASFMEKRPASFPDRVSDGMPDFFPWRTEERYS